jgi:DNA-binding transcriptional MerR regulator
MIEYGTGLLTIGELARATGLTVRTIRYWSDEGALPPVARSSGGYRLYDAESVARLELIRTLRELGLGLDDVRKVPVIREQMRNMAVDLPDEPTPEQVDAWVELAELLQDPEFRAHMRTVAEFNAAGRGPETPAGASMWFARKLVQSAAEARERGVAPESPEAERILRDLLGDADPAAVLERLKAGADDKVARYRELLVVVKGRGPASARRAEFAWVVAALEARAGG